VVGDAVARVVELEAVPDAPVRPRPVAPPNAQMTKDHVGRLDADGPAAQTDTVAGRRLSGNGDATVLDNDVPGQVDDPADIENDRARAGRAAECVSQAAGPPIIQVGYVDDLTAAPAESQRAIAFGSREGALRTIGELRRKGTREVVSQRQIDAKTKANYRKD
jgi:hypothetical protein